MTETNGRNRFRRYLRAFLVVAIICFVAGFLYLYPPPAQLGGTLSFLLTIFFLTWVFFTAAVTVVRSIAAFLEAFKRNNGDLEER